LAPWFLGSCCAVGRVLLGWSGPGSIPGPDGEVDRRPPRAVLLAEDPDGSAGRLEAGDVVFDVESVTEALEDDGRNVARREPADRDRLDGDLRVDREDHLRRHIGGRLAVSGDSVDL